MISNILEYIKKRFGLDEESLKRKLSKEEKVLVFKVHSFFDMTRSLDPGGFKPAWQVYPVDSFFTEKEIQSLLELKSKLSYAEKAFITKTTNIKLVDKVESFSSL